MTSERISASQTVFSNKQPIVAREFSFMQYLQQRRLATYYKTPPGTGGVLILGWLRGDLRPLAVYFSLASERCVACDGRKAFLSGASYIIRCEVYAEIFQRFRKSRIR